MLSCHLWMDGWLLQIHWLAVDQTAPLPRVWSTEIVFCSREFIVMTVQRLSAVLPKDHIPDSGRWDCETGSKTTSGWSRSCNFRRGVLEYKMHLSDDYYCTWCPSYRLYWYAEAFDGLGNVLPRTTIQDREIPPPLGNKVTISWLRSIQQAILPGHVTEWYGDESTRAHACSSSHGHSSKPFGELKNSLHKSLVVWQELSVLSPYGIVLVPYWSHDRVHGESSGGVSLSEGWFESIPCR